MEGKQCRRLDSSINALMMLLRDKSFERIIKMTKQKKSSKMLQIIASHNKSKNIELNKIHQIEENVWLITSESDSKIKYCIEKVDIICNTCVLRCDTCNICVHTFKCSCMNNVIYFNICKHIHATARLNIPQQDLNNKHESIKTIDQSTILENAVAISKTTISLDDDIKQKMEIMFGLYNRSTLNDENKNKILNHCNKIISIISSSPTIGSTTVDAHMTRKCIEKQNRFFGKKKSSLNILRPSSTNENNLIRDSLLDNINGEVLNIHCTDDHTYC